MINQERRVENQLLWKCFQAIHTHYLTPAMKGDVELTRLFLNCMLDLVEQTQPAQAPALEKMGLWAARAYWQEQETQTSPILFSLITVIESKITYHDPVKDNRLRGLIQVLSIDNDHCDDFSEFLENIYHSGVPLETILPILKKHFSAVPELQSITA